MSELPRLPPIASAPLSVLLVAADPAAATAEVVACWREHLTGSSSPFEIVVVGPDSHPGLLSLNTGTGQEPVVVTCPEPAGVGSLLRAGIAATRHPLLAIAPCDGQYHPRDLPRLLAAIDDVHLAIGYRVAQSVPALLLGLDELRRWASRIVLGYLPPRRDCWLGWRGWWRRWLIRHVFGVPVQDAQCGFRLVRRDVLDRFPLQSQGSFAMVEMLAKANHLGCILAEVPVSWVAPAAEPFDPTFRPDASLVFHHPDFVDPTRVVAVG